MVSFDFYTVSYGGDSIPAAEWAAVCRDAEAKVGRYERIYMVRWLADESRSMAVCAVADAMYGFAKLQIEGGAVQGASVGSVSESYAAVAAPDTATPAQESEFYRCVQLYADIYRG